MRKALEISGFLHLPAADHRREAQHFRVRLAVARDQRGQATDDLFEYGGARIDAVDAGRQQQRLGDRIERAYRLNRFLECHIHLTHASRYGCFYSSNEFSRAAMPACWSAATPLLYSREFCHC